MKYLLWWLLLAPAFSFAEETPSSDLGAQFPVEAPTKAPAETTSPNRYILGIHTVDFNYQEPGLMSDRGRLNGLAFTYQYNMDTERNVKVVTDYVQGNTFYDGALQTNTGITTPYTSTESFRAMNLELILGRRPTDNFWAYTVGVGYRNTFDANDNANPYDYRRDITYYYLLMGVNPVIYNKNKIKSLLNLEFSSLMGGGAKTYLSDVSPSYRDVNFEFQYGAGLKIGLETFISLVDNHQFMVDLSYKYWTLGDSKVEYIGNGYGVEPHNTTGLTSITVGYVF